MFWEKYSDIEETKISKKLLIVGLSVLVVALVAGSYYYYHFVLNNGFSGVANRPETKEVKITDEQRQEIFRLMKEHPEIFDKKEITPEVTSEIKPEVNNGKVEKNSGSDIVSNLKKFESNTPTFLQMNQASATETKVSYPSK